MLRIWLIAALAPVVAFAADSTGNRQAARYSEILLSTPDHELARERLWKIHSAAGTADTLLDTFRSKAETQATAALALGYLLIEADQIPEAIEQFASLKNDPATAIPALIGSAAAHRAANDPASAAANLADAITLAPPEDHAELLRQQAEDLDAAGDSTAATSARTLLLDADPSNIATRNELAATSEDPAGHLQWLAENAPPPDRLNALLALADAAEVANQFDVAIDYATDALTLAGRNHWQRPEIQARLARIHEHAGTTDEFIKTLTTESERDPGLWANTAEIAGLLGRRSVQLSSIRSAQSHFPNDQNLIASRAAIEADFGSLETAAKLYDSLLARRPNDQALVFARAEMDIRAGNQSAAATRISNWLNSQSDPTAARPMVIAFLENNRMATALGNLLAKEAKDGDPLAQERLAELDLKRGRRDEAVERILAKPSQPSDPESTLSAAALLNREGLHAEAAQLAESVLKRDSQNPEAARLAANARHANGDTGQAQAILTSTALNSPENATDLDRLLFEILNDSAGSTTPSIDDPFGQNPKLAPEVTQLAESLAKSLSEKSSEAEILRAARWLEWANQARVAADWLKAGSQAHPQSIPIHESLVRILATIGDTTAAIDALANLAAADPAQSTQYERTKANLMADSGDLDAALATLQTLADAYPDNADILIDLAVTQQRTGDWYAALKTWRTAHQFADPSRQAQIRTSLLAAADRLGMTEAGIEFAANAAQSATDDTARRGAWSEALDLAKRKCATDQLESILQSILASDPNRTDAILALAELYGESNQPDLALALIRQARVHTRQNPDLIRHLTQLTKRFGLESLTLPLARDLAASEDTFDAWSELGTLQSANGDLEAATTTYQAIQRKFGRDPEALSATADAFERIGNPEAASECRALAASLDPPDPRALATVGRNAVRAGDPETAITAFEKLLAITPPGAAPSILPGGEVSIALEAQRAYSVALQALGGMVDRQTQQMGRAFSGDVPPIATSELAALRLEATRALGRLASGGAFREEWLATCAANPNAAEAAWGFFEAGAYREAMDRLSEIQSDPNIDAERAFVWAGLIGNEPETIRAWINADSDDRRRRTEVLVVALSYALQTRAATFSGEDLADLFPPKSVPTAEIWQIAWLFAAHSHIAEAATLGDRVLSQTAPAHKPAAALRLASWHLLLKQHAAALASLTQVPLDRSTGIDHDAFKALRMRWLLSNPNARASIREEILALPRNDSTLAALAIVMALEGESQETITPIAREILAGWQKNRGRSGDYDSVPLSQAISSSIGQLMAWNLPEAAAAILNASDDTDEANITLAEGRSANWENERKLWRAVLAIRSVPPRQLPFAITESIPAAATPQDLSSIARQLDLLGYPIAASAVRDIIADRFPVDLSGFNDQLSSASRDRDHDRRLQILLRQIEAPSLRANPKLFIDHAVQIGLLALDLRRPDLALEAANAALAIPSKDERLISIKARSLLEADATEALETFWRESLATETPGAALALAPLLPALEAIEILNSQPSTPGSLLELAGAHLANDDLPSALAILRTLGSNGNWSEVARVAAFLPPSPEITRILTNGLNSAAPPDERVECGITLLELYANALDQPAFATTFHSLRRVADAHPAVAAQIIRSLRPFWQNNPNTRAWALSLLDEAWDNGRGNRFAGEDLVIAAIEDGDADAVRRRVRQFLDVNRFADRLLESMATALSDAGFHAEAALAWNTLWEFRPERMTADILAARELWESGQQEDALSSIKPWLDVRWYDRSIHLELARFYRHIGMTAEAKNLYAEIAADDPGVSIPEVWLSLASIELDEGKLELAKLYLTTAALNPGLSDIGPIVDWLAARGDLKELKRDEIPFKFSAEAQANLDFEIATRLAAKQDFEAAAAWLTPDSLLRNDGPDLAATTSLGGAESAIESLWASLRSEHPARRTARKAHAKYLRKIADAKDSEGHRLAAAEAFPEDVGFALEVSQSLADAGKPDLARSLITKVLAAHIPQKDRLTARQSLNAL